MYADLLVALRGGNLQPLRGWLTEQGVRPDELRRLTRWNAPSPDGPAADGRSHAAEVLTGQIDPVEQVFRGPALVLLCLHGEIWQSWEVSYRFRPLFDAVDGARDWLAARGGSLPPEEQLAARAVVVLMQSVKFKILTENALTAGYCGAVAESADASRAKGDEVAELAARLTDDVELRDLLESQTTVHRHHDRAIAAAGFAAVRCLATGEPLGQALSVISETERIPGLGSQRYSILRAHRHRLLALEAARGADWLRIDAGKLAYIYPFAIRGCSAEETVTRAGREAQNWLLAGTMPITVHDFLDLDDAWDGQDSTGRQYDGALIELPDVTLYYGDGRHLATVSAQVRLSNLGNHYVRFSTELVDATPHDVYATMLRASPNHGEIEVSFAGTGTRVAVRLSELATLIASDVAARLDDPQAHVRTIARPGMFHLVMSVQGASRVAGPAAGAARREEVLTIDELRQTEGVQVLTNPVTDSIGALVEWISYNRQPEATASTVTLAKEWMITTCNTTVLVALGVPRFVAHTRESVAEFVASMEGLIEGWLSDLAQYYERVRDLQARVHASEAGGSVSIRDLRQLATEVNQERRNLHEFTIEARSRMSFLQSSSLVSSPVVALIMQRLLRASGYQRRIDEFNTRIEEVLDERLRHSIERLTGQRAEREAQAKAVEDHKRRTRLDTLLAVIAAIGVSGLMQILQSGYDVRSGGSAAMVTAVLLLSTMVGLGFRLLSGRHQDDDADAD